MYSFAGISSYFILFIPGTTPPVIKPHPLGKAIFENRTGITYFCSTFPFKKIIIKVLNFTCLIIFPTSVAGFLYFILLTGTQIKTLKKNIVI